MSESCRLFFTKSVEWLTLSPSNISDSDEPGRSEALENFDEALGLEFSIEVVISCVDAYRLKSDEFRGRSNAENIAVPNQPKDGW